MSSSAGTASSTEFSSIATIERLTVSTRDDRHRDAVLHRAAHRADVARHPGDQVAGAGALDAAEWQPQDRVDDVFARRGEQVLAEQRRGALAQEGEQRLRDHDHQDDQGRARSTPDAEVSPETVRSIRSPSRRGTSSAAAAARRVEHDHRGEGAPAPPDQPAEEREDSVVVGHRPAALGAAGGGVDVLRPLLAERWRRCSARSRSPIGASAGGGTSSAGIVGGSSARSRQVSAEVASRSDIARLPLLDLGVRRSSSGRPARPWRG